MRVANGLYWTRAILPDSVSVGVDVLYSLFLVCVLSDWWRRRCHDRLGRFPVSRLGRLLICIWHSARRAFVSELGVRMSSNGCYRRSRLRDGLLGVVSVAILIHDNAARSR